MHPLRVIGIQIEHQSPLLEIAAADANEAIFPNLSIEQCIENARNRPWEPHKYRSKEKQDKNLGLLIAWISQHAERTDVFSLASHMQLYQDFNGKKTMLDRNRAHTPHLDRAVNRRTNLYCRAAMAPTAVVSRFPGRP